MKLESIKSIIDLSIIAAPFIFIFTHGVNFFLFVFYLLYLPCVILDLFKLKKKTPKKINKNHII